MSSSLKEAFERQKYASEFRKETGGDIAKTLGVSFEIISDMPHNTVYYEDGFTVYRKGAVRCNSDNIYFLPAHLGAKVMAYTINDTLPMQTMPHGTGRSMPRSEIKELAMQRDIDYLKSIVYLPKNMNDSSLKDMIPEAFNNYDQIIRNMLLNPEYDKMFLMMGSSKIEGSLFKL